MNTRCICSVLMVCALLAVPAGLYAQTPMGTAFTYQGRLTDGGSPADGQHDFRFSLYNAPSRGIQVGTTLEVANVDVANGLFTVRLDFGAAALPGDARWLEIEVKSRKGDLFTQLFPRQQITPAPYAVYSQVAASVVGGTGLSLPYDGVVTTDGVAFGLHSTGAEGGTTLLAEHGSPECVAINAQVSGQDATAIQATASGQYGTALHVHSSGVDGLAFSAGSGADAAGTARLASQGAAVSTLEAQAYGTGARAVYGKAAATTGANYGIFGEAVSASGFAGYFLGRGYFSGNVGIGTTNPGQRLQVGETTDSSNHLRFATNASGNSAILFWDGESSYSGMVQYTHNGDYMRFYTRSGASAGERMRITSEGDVGIGTTSPAAKLHVNGTARMNGFQLGVAAIPGHVLTANASGIGTWQAPTGGGFVLPFDGSASDSTTAFRVTNTHSTSGSGITGSGTQYGVVGQTASGAGTGVYGWGTTGVYGSTNSGIGVRGASTGTSGVAVKGTAGGSPQGTGGWFESGSSTGRGVYGLATSLTGGTAVVAEAQGSSSVGLDAASPNVGLKASGGVAAAELYGKLKIYQHGTTNLVLELGKGLDYAEGFHVSAQDDRVGPGSVLVIDPVYPGKLTISTRAYDRKVAGIVAGANGLGSGVRLGGEGFDHDVALAGRVYCNVTAGDESIEPGDLLTTSHVPGHAMKVKDHAAGQGAILGKAMEPLAAGQRGMILVLVTLQ